jgi:hypothetical protein
MFTSRLLNLFALAALTTTSVVSGFSPDLRLSHTSTQAAYAQEASFTRYVRAVFAIEQQRRVLMSQVKNMTGGDLPDNVCDSGFSKLSAQFQGPVRDICNQFNRSAMDIVNKHNVAAEFNEFRKQTMSSDPKVRRDMQEKISSEMRLLKLSFSN